MKITRTAAIILILTMVFTFTSCGGNGEEGSSSAGSGTPSLDGTEWVFVIYDSSDRRMGIENHTYTEDSVDIDGNTEPYVLYFGDEAYEKAGISKEDMAAIEETDLFYEGSGSGTFITIEYTDRTDGTVYGYISDAADMMLLEHHDEYGNLLDYTVCENKNSELYADHEEEIEAEMNEG